MPTDSPHLAKQLRPVAVAMSPVLWSRFKPDRFDSYSCGAFGGKIIFTSPSKKEDCPDYFPYIHSYRIQKLKAADCRVQQIGLRESDPVWHYPNHTYYSRQIYGL